MTLIDCKSWTLCGAADNPYVCLSYVWGDTPAAAANPDNAELANIPQTISDAISVTLELGIQYLWVDRYCIDPGDALEKHDAIRSMGSVYRNADFTIIATVDSDSNYGLPGVSRSRSPGKFCDSEGHPFTLLENPEQVVQESVWHTRGWTYQEMLLSRRRLIFIDNQVYFQCQEHHLVSDTPGLMMLEKLQASHTWQREDLRIV